MSSEIEPIDWYASSWRDFKKFPETVRKRMDVALKVARLGGKHQSAKPLRGVGNARVLEVSVAYQGNAYRLIYTIPEKGHIIVLHCFQKKSTLGISTPKPDSALILKRLKDMMKERYL